MQSDSRFDSAIRSFGTLALHPFLFAAASIAKHYAWNLHYVYVADALAVSAAALAAALLLLLAFGLVFRSLGPKAAILASAALVAGVFYGDIVDAANQYLGLGLSAIGALPIVLTVLVAVCGAVAWLRFDFVPANAILNGIAFMMFIVPAWQIAAHSWQVRGSLPVSAALPEEMSAAAAPAGNPAVADETPRHIFYLVFDRYASQAVLSDYYGFDNSGLAGFLEENGFYVASNSHANYQKTAHSLASTFDMNYLDSIKQDPRSRDGNWHPLYDMLRDHRVGRFLKSRGYKFVQLGSWWGPTQRNHQADEIHSFGFSEFNYWYLRRTIVAPILETVAPNTTLGGSLQSDLGQCQRMPRKIEKLKELGARREKTFVFAHILVPHDPYVFGADGRCLSPDEVAASEEENYIAQVRYANLIIRDVVSTLLATDGPKPIIILQSDEGPFPPIYKRDGGSWQNATIDELRIKMGILNAFHLPDRDYADLDPQVTSVNTFRLVFDKYFGTQLQRLQERIYTFPDNVSLYDFHEITKLLREETE